MKPLAAKILTPPIRGLLPSRRHMGTQLLRTSARAARCASLPHVAFRALVVAVFGDRTFCMSSVLSKKSNQSTSTRRPSSRRANKPSDNFKSVARRLGEWNDDDFDVLADGVVT